nr:cysteine-rich receptor-like protein kinase [Tanacetum cinerariifolium]
MEYPRRISLDKQLELEGEVSNDEIKRVVWDCETDKAPGPDGFTFGFYRRFWYLIDNDVYVSVKHFFIHGEIHKGCNSSFIALIPKIPNANLVNDFRPISLIGSLYRIIAKILANRLAGVLGDIVNEKKQSLVFKVDFEKAYDSVQWDFLDDILGKLGFGDKWPTVRLESWPIFEMDLEVTGSRSCWLNIVHEAKILTQKGITLRDFMQIKLRNVENTGFWEDCWIEGDSIRNRFPRLYTLESCKRITVGEKMRQPSLEFSFRRNTRGGVEQEQLGDLVTLMHDVSLSPMADRWTWALENSGEFIVLSVRKHIDDKLIHRVGSKTRWIKYVPIKVNVNA